jgi:hypothetical protein
MALSRFVVTGKVTVAPDTLATVVAGEPGTGAPADPGNVGTVSPGTGGKYSWLPAAFLPGMVVYADSSPGTAPALLYQAIGASNLRAFVQVQGDVGHAGLSN